MANPARALLEIFDTWSAKGTIESSRVSQTGSISMTQHRNAMKYLYDIDVVVDRWDADGQDVGLWRGCLGAWTGYVLGFPYNWRDQNYAQTARSEARLDMLRALDQLLEGTSQAPATDQVDRIESFLQDILNALVADKTLSEPLRAHILRLVQELQAALQAFRVTGRFEDTDAAGRLWVALGAAAEDSSQDSTLWQRLRTNIVIPATAGLVANMPGLALAALTGSSPS